MSVTYVATLSVREETVLHGSSLLHTERQRRGTRAGRRSLSCFKQAILVIRWFFDGTRMRQLARDNATSRSMAYAYLDEGITVLAARAPGLESALLAARQARDGTVVGVDVDCRAVEATQRTLAMNQAGNAQARLSDCTEAVEGQTFSAVVTNPPFHQERSTTYAIAEQIIRDAARVLCARGQLYLVANSFLGYAPIIEREFGHADLLCETKSYKVWHATR